MREGFWVGGRRYVVLSGDVGSFDVYEDPCRLGFHFGQHGAFDIVKINLTSALIQDFLAGCRYPGTSHEQEVENGCY